MVKKTDSKDPVSMGKKSKEHQIDEILEIMAMYEEEHGGETCPIEHLKKHNITDLEIKELVDTKLMDIVDSKINLSDKGKIRIQRIMRAHRLAECLMIGAFSLPHDTMEEHACSFEHILNQPVVDSVCTLLGHPRFCPHGKSIPAGDCCQKKQNSVKPIVFPLIELDIEEHGRIVSIFTEKLHRLDFLTSVGIHPGTTFFLERKKPVFVLKIGENRFAVEEDVARDILVRRL